MLNLKRCLESHRTAIESWMVPIVKHERHMTPEIAAYKESVCTGKGFHKKRGMPCLRRPRPDDSFSCQQATHHAIVEPRWVRLDKVATWGAP